MSQSSAVLVIDMANDFVYPGGTGETDVLAVSESRVRADGGGVE
jgi:nicotinamidase-related amidase